ncbi:MAG: hypothetical protein ABII22_03400 [Candidatus Micrarchaeota archaeon]
MAGRRLRQGYSTPHNQNLATFFSRRSGRILFENMEATGESRGFRKAFSSILNNVGPRILDFSFLNGFLVCHLLQLKAAHDAWQSQAGKSRITSIGISEQVVSEISRRIKSAPGAKDFNLEFFLHKNLDQSVIRDGFYGGFDTIIVANLFFHFPPDDRIKIASKFTHYLADGGLLISLEAFPSGVNAARFVSRPLQMTEYLAGNLNISNAFQNVCFPMSVVELHHEILTDAGLNLLGHGSRFRVSDEITIHSATFYK